jgi:hypothetical protein
MLVSKDPLEDDGMIVADGVHPDNTDLHVVHGSLLTFCFLLLQLSQACAVLCL